MEPMQEKEYRGLRIAAGIVAVLAGIAYPILGACRFVLELMVSGSAAGMIMTAFGVVCGVTAAVLMAIAGFARRSRPVRTSVLTGMAALLIAATEVLCIRPVDYQAVMILIAAALIVCALTAFRVIPWRVVAPITAALALAAAEVLYIRMADYPAAVILPLGNAALFLLSLLHWLSNGESNGSPSPTADEEAEKRAATARTKRIIAWVGGIFGALCVAVLLIIVPFAKEAEYNQKYKVTDVDSVTSPDGTYELLLQSVGEPEFPFGSTPGRVVLKKGDETVGTQEFSVSDDGGDLRPANWRVEWGETGVTVTLIGSEQEDRQLTLPYPN